MKKALSFLLVLMLGLVTACGSETSKDSIDVIQFADADWDSIRFHNSVAQIIIENGYEYKTKVVAGTAAATIQALRQGNINVYMEMWIDNNRDLYEKAQEAGDIVDLSLNYNDNRQGVYVPTYVIKGDPERGIEPMAPDLKTFQDLEQYKELFKDPEDSSKGRLIGGPTSWGVTVQLGEKLANSGLDQHYNFITAGSDAAVIASLTGAYNKGEPWVGYYFSPTRVTAIYDLTLLEDVPFDQQVWNETRGTEFPINDVVITVHKDFLTQAPDVVEFLKQYQTSNALTEAALGYMEDHNASPDEAANWWMKEHEDVWTQWLTDDEMIEKVKAALK